MNTDETTAEALERMYDALINPEQREERARQTERKKRIEDRKADTGAYVI